MAVSAALGRKARTTGQAMAAALHEPRSADLRCEVEKLVGTVFPSRMSTVAIERVALKRRIGKVAGGKLTLTANDCRALIEAYPELRDWEAGRG